MASVLRPLTKTNEEGNRFSQFGNVLFSMRQKQRGGSEVKSLTVFSMFVLYQALFQTI